MMQNSSYTPIIALAFEELEFKVKLGSDRTNHICIGGSTEVKSQSFSWCDITIFNT